MKTSSLTTVMVIVLGLALIGYGLYATTPAREEVAVQVESLTPAAEKKDIDPDILNKQIIRDVETLKVFGKRPLGDTTLDRANPFEGF